MEIVVIGGGAAGMMAAVTAAEQGGNVTLLERNSFLGVKLNITGKGRCNLTNDCDNDTLLKQVVTNNRFLYSAFSAFSTADVKEFFEELGVPLKTERGNRVFPVSDRAKDVTDALKKRMSKLKVKVMQCRAEAIAVEDGAVCGVKTDKGYCKAERVILATGGLTYPKTGSSGDGYKMAAALGHTVVPCRPSLVGLKAMGLVPSRLEGLSLKNVSISMVQGGRERYQGFGELLFTAMGVSGPLILSASAHYNPLEECKLYINLKPALDADTLDKRILKDFDENLNRAFANSLSALLPAKLVPVIVEMSGISPNKRVNEVTREERLRLVELFQGMEFVIKGSGGFDEAVVTAGGISVKEINPKTMESKLVNGLYFAGEIIDTDAYTGGFNLQIAWSTARVAGQHSITI